MIPQPLLIVIEDVGWWRGFSRFERNEPYRTGLERMHCLDDYHALITLSRTLNTQILAGFVLGEWDTRGLLCELPSATWMGDRWQGSGMDPALLSQAADLIKNHGKNLRLAVHGLGHEFWEQGRVSRTEFHDADNRMRDVKDIEKHLDYFGKLLRSTGIQDTFPDAFIPPALKHSFGYGKEGMQAILARFGIRYVLTAFEKARQYAPPLTPHVTEECHVILIERGRAPMIWSAVAPEPECNFDQPVLPLHWSNILHADPGQNHTVVESWARYLLSGIEKQGCLLLPTVEETLDQIIYHHLARIEPATGGLVLDISDVNRVTTGHGPGTCYLAIPPSAKVHPHEGRLEPSDAIRDGLVRLIPSGSTNTIRIYY